MPFVESPIHRIVNVNWGALQETTLEVVLNANMTGPPITEPQDTTSHMIVSVTNLPPLERTTLEVGNPNGGGNDDQVLGSFPDQIPPAAPTGTIDGSYFFHYAFTGGIPVVTFALGATAFYGTSAQGRNRFGGAASVSMSVTIQTTGFYSGHWIASASSSIAESQSLSGDMGDVATVTATLTLEPPSLSFG